MLNFIPNHEEIISHLKIKAEHRKSKWENAPNSSKRNYQYKKLQEVRKKIRTWEEKYETFLVSKG